MVLPAWSAAIVHVPAVLIVTNVPLILQTEGVLMLKATASPDDAVALAVVEPPTDNADGLMDITDIVWVAGVMVIDAGALTAALKLPSAALVAVIEQVPVPLVIETTPLVEFTVQAVDVPALKPTVPVPLPPDVPAVMPDWANVALFGRPVMFRTP